jgi:UDP-3-O-[3-hydroxymyristoyl] glucosamine N-acyltransferase
MKGTTISDILPLVPNGTFHGDASQRIESAISIKDLVGENGKLAVTWLNDKTAGSMDSTTIIVGLLVLSQTSYEHLKGSSANFLIVPNPRAAFFRIIKEFFGNQRPTGIERSAHIHASTTIGEGCYIGNNVVIEENCTIGSSTIILHNTVILRGTQIGNNVSIGCNNTIGNYGFGYEKDDEGQYEVLEHIGNVVIHDNVEIHNNTCIDRGVMGSTVLHENVKIDNLVHIAHGVIIERNALVIANAVVAGSVVVGANSWIAPSVTIRNKAVIAPNTMTGIGSVIVKDTAENQTYIGNPATTMEEFKKWSEVKKKLMNE